MLTGEQEQMRLGGLQKEGAVSRNTAYKTDPKSIHCVSDGGTGDLAVESSGLKPDYGGVMQRQQV